MFKSVTALLSLTTFAAANDGGYGYSAPASSQQYNAYGGYPAQGAAPYHGASYGGYGGYYRKTFPRPHPIIDPKYYQGVLTGFQQCVEHKCDTLPRAYTTTAAESVHAVGAYTACVTSCAASEMMRVISDFKVLLAKLFDIGSAHLNDAHRYLAGKGDYDVLEQNTRIRDSCCLPNDYFVPWDELMIYAKVKFKHDSSWEKRIVPARDVYEYCTSKENGDNAEKLWGKLIPKCKKEWDNYLHDLQTNVGHLVLAPKCKTLAPEGACAKKLENNPQAEEFGEDMCVAYECEYKGKKKSVVDHPILKYPTKALTYEESCEPDVSDDTETVIKYRRVPRHALKYYAVTSGLPSKREGRKCEYEQGLFGVDDEGRFDLPSKPSHKAIHAVQKCPRAGRFEYCNMKQYVHWLQNELFNVADCPICDLQQDDDDDDRDSVSTLTSYTLACLFRVVTLKCDCMEAVLNCYEHEYKFTSDLGKTLGKAASVLCGFLLCQKPNVYSLLGEQPAIDRANIMREVLMQVGAIAPRVSSIPPATFAFLSFGLGMVCVYVVTKMGKKAKVGVEEGYRNLI